MLQFLALISGGDVAICSLIAMIAHGLVLRKPVPHLVKPMEDTSIPASLSSENWSPSGKDLIFAWLVHLLTATGAVRGLLSIIAINEGDYKLAFLWIAIAVVVDSFDGFAARAANVKQVLPAFDGALLDNMVDYLNYVFVPAYFLYAAELLPAQLSFILPVLILLASAYQFSQGDAKTEDHFFTGFPSYWNVVVVYMMLFGPAPWIYALILTILVAMVFIPIKYIYPSRTEVFPRLTMALGLIWAVVFSYLLIAYPDQPAWLVWASLFYPIYYYALSFYTMYHRGQIDG